MIEKMHTSVHYERQLREAKENLLYLGALAETAIRNAMQALLQRDSDLAQAVIDGDETLDRLNEEIDEKCILLLALRQPIAKDLRFIATVIKINGHLERIGDMAVNVTEKAIALNREPQLKPYIDLPRMAEITQEMIKQSLDSLVHEDIVLANAVRSRDKEVDDLNEQIFRELLVLMMEDTGTIHRSLLLTQISKGLERISDHATSIADMVVYMATGKNVRHKAGLGEKR